MNFNTKVIHGGQSPEPSTGAVMPPIFQTSTYIQKSPGEHKGYEYSRGGNPTRTALEKALAAIENGNYGFAFSSGLAATDAVLKLLDPGDEVISIDDMYGGSYRMFTKIFQKYGIKFHFIDFNDTYNLVNTINERTKLIWLETPTNPLMKIVDIASVTEIAKAKNILVAVDNTFATPYLQKPLDMGADIVMHSATKYLGGHSDLIAGALIVNNEELAHQIYFQQYAGGSILAPQESYLVLRGIKTLALRMQRHCENGLKVAEYLNEHPIVDTVYYPGLTSHVGHQIALKQMNHGFGGMVSFTFKSRKKEDAFKFLTSLKIFTLAESLGGVESLANYPPLMTHASIPESKRKEIGITDDFIRLSIGIEDIEDLLHDLSLALSL